MQRNWGLNRNPCICCQYEGIQHQSNLLWIFSCQKKINGVSTVNVFKVAPREAITYILSGVKAIHPINYKISRSCLQYPVAVCIDETFLPSSSVRFWPGSTEQIFMSCVWKWHTVCFLTLLLKNPFHTDRRMLLKHIYTVARATTDTDNYERIGLWINLLLQ